MKRLKNCASKKRATKRTNPKGRKPTREELEAYARELGVDLENASASQKRGLLSRAKTFLDSHRYNFTATDTGQCKRVRFKPVRAKDAREALQMTKDRLGSKADQYKDFQVSGRGIQINPTKKNPTHSGVKKTTKRNGLAESNQKLLFWVLSPAQEKIGIYAVTGGTKTVFQAEPGIAGSVRRFPTLDAVIQYVNAPRGYFATKRLSTRPKKNPTKPVVERYSFKLRGHHLRYATRVIFPDGRTVSFDELLPKGEAIRHALWHLEKHPEDYPKKNPLHPAVSGAAIGAATGRIVNRIMDKLESLEKKVSRKSRAKKRATKKRNPSTPIGYSSIFEADFARPGLGYRSKKEVYARLPVHVSREEYTAELRNLTQGDILTRADMDAFYAMGERLGKTHKQVFQQVYNIVLKVHKREEAQKAKKRNPLGQGKGVSTVELARLVTKAYHLGYAAFKSGKVKAPAQDAALMNLLHKDLRSADFIKIFDAWHRGQMQASADAPVKNPSKARSNPAPTKPKVHSEVASLHKEFLGRPHARAINGHGSALTPAQVARLGTLQGLYVNGRWLKNFPSAARLVGDQHGNLHIVGVRYVPNGGDALNLTTHAPKTGEQTFVANPRQLVRIGDVEKIDYGARKTHLHDGGHHHFVHTFGEEGGAPPVLCLDREGYMILRGGDYTTMPEGIRN